MRLLVIGGAGQLGGSVAEQALARGDEVVATYLARTPRLPGATLEPFDKADSGRAAELLERYRPELVVDTGALHNVDYCEQHPEEAVRVNATATTAIARACASRGVRFLFVSTDFVFDGGDVPPYDEESPARPQSEYARSKRAGEVGTLAASAAHLVVRPSVIYSWIDTRRRAESSSGKGVNFGTWLVEEVRRGRTVRIVEDQIASPTLAEDLAGALLALARGAPGGLYHAAGRTALDRWTFSRRLVERLGLSTELVTPVRTADLHQVAPRPLNSSLSSEKLARTTGYRMLPLDAALDRFAAAYRADPGVRATP